MSSGRAALPASQKPQLNYNQLYELLWNGLAKFIICFTGNAKANDDFIENFKSSLHPTNPQQVNNFNQFGTLLVKANHPGIYTLSDSDQADLEKLGFPLAANLEKLGFKSAIVSNHVHVFFQKSLVVNFTKNYVKDKYRERMLQLIDAVYGLVEAATCSYECEQHLIKYDKHNQLLVDKEKQDPRFSSLDLQFANGLQSLRLLQDGIIAAKKKTRNTTALFAATQKMNSNAAAANTEYLKHVHATKNAAQTAQHQREVSELKQQQASGQRDDSESQDSDSRDSHNQHAPSQDLLPLQPEPKTDMEKDTTRLQEIAERTTQEAKETKVDGNALINAMSDLITVSADPAGTADALLTAIVTWEKRALAYLENKVATPRGYLAVFNFMAPAASTTQAIRNELKEILQQCIVLATCDGHLKEAVGLLNQHKYRLEDNHAKTDLSRELVYVQLETLTDIITNVARTRFDYPAKQILPPPATVTKSLS